VGNEAKPQWLFSEVFEGAGVLKSNMTDMWKYLEAQLTESSSDAILHQAIKQTHITTSANDITESNTGLAWVITKLDDGQEVVWHNGGTLSQNSFIGFNKTSGKGVIILMNSSVEGSGEIKLGWELLKAMHKH